MCAEIGRLSIPPEHPLNSVQFLIQRTLTVTTSRLPARPGLPLPVNQQSPHL